MRTGERTGEGPITRMVAHQLLCSGGVCRMTSVQQQKKQMVSGSWDTIGPSPGKIGEGFVNLEPSWSTSLWPGSGRQIAWFK